MPFDVTTLPKAHMPGVPLPHEGTLSEAEQARLRELGYEPVDVRTVHGPRAVELALEGMGRGTVPFDKNRFQALEALRKLYADTTKEAKEAELEDKGDKPDALAILKTEAEQGPRKKAPQRHRGRPPGPSKQKEK